MVTRIFPILLLLLSGIALYGQPPATGTATNPYPTLNTNNYTPPDGAARRARYLKSMVGPEAWLRNIASAGISTARNRPNEWGPHWEGFGKRVASNVGKNIINSSVRFGLDEAMNVDSHYYPSERKGVGPKLRNAVVSVFTARNRSGDRVIGIPRLAGAYAAPIIARETWYPDRYGWRDGVRDGTISIGMNVVYNLIREFVRNR